MTCSKVVRLTHPISDGELAVIALGEDMGQPNCGDPAPTKALLQPMAGQMAVQQIRQVDLFHQFDQQDEIVNRFGGDGQVRGIHPPRVSKNSLARRLREW